MMLVGLGTALFAHANQHQIGARCLHPTVFRGVRRLTAGGGHLHFVFQQSSTSGKGKRTSVYFLHI